MYWIHGPNTEGQRSVQPALTDSQSLQVKLTHEPELQAPAARDAVVQGAPSLPATDEHPAAEQVSTVHGLPSSHISGATGVQIPF